MSPAFRCTKGHTFDRPDQRTAAVIVYRAEYGKSFQPFDGLSPDDLESLSLARSRQNAIRELDLDKTLSALRRHGLWPRFVERTPQ
jgi:hypothetical protein